MASFPLTAAPILVNNAEVDGRLLGLDAAALGALKARGVV